ncbi:MAG TPA: glycoside hydrolase family 9 protein [Clostridia bacterium]
MNTKRTDKHRRASKLIAVMLTGMVALPCTLQGGSVLAQTISPSQYQTDSRIRVNSIGFLPNSDKKATIATSSTDFYLVKDTGDVVFTGRTTSMSSSDTSEQVYIADFSSVSDEGTYFIAVPGVGKSVNFKIAKDVYNDAFKSTMLGMYLTRCGESVSATFNGQTFSHAACHKDDGYLDYITGQHTKKEGTGGWHDAGDFNKYIVNAGISVAQMGFAWEQFKDQLEGVKLTMPESSNSMPDYLDEIKYEMDWVLKMQYPDGSGKVSHKLSTTDFCAFIMPESENDPRYYTSWGSAATADFVGMAAMSARIFKPYDAAYSQKCLDAAKLSYACLKSNPGNVSPDLSKFKTGDYNTTDSDDRLWAAAEMWETTGDASYLSDFESAAGSVNPKVAVDFDWGSVANLGMYTYLLSDRTGKNQSLYNSIKTDLLSAADSAVKSRNSNAYGRPLTSYYWGCNGAVARQTMLLQIANKLSPKSDYINTSLDAIGHLFGRNYYDRSYVTGVGINPPMHPHDRRSGGDSITQPWPGQLVGGGWPTGKDWQDVQDDYKTNEIAINWDTALIYALAGFYNSGNISTPTPTPPPTSTPTPPATVIYGDVDGNGKVNSADLSYVKKYILETIDSFPSANGELAADVNRDGKINSSDYSYIKKYILGLVTKLPPN